MIETLRSCCAEAGLAVTEEQLQQCAAFGARLIETNKVMNLTAITDPKEMAVKHFFDCMVALEALNLPEGARVIDVGTGAGFPGIPFAILRPDLKITLLDSTGKKINFVAESARELGLSNVSTLHMRAEDAGRDPKLREQFDLACARAVAAMVVLSEYTLPLVKVGGRLAAMKGPGAEEECRDAEPMIRTLGGELDGIRMLEVPGQTRSLILVRKQKATPGKYPRKPGKIPKPQA